MALPQLRSFIPKTLAVIRLPSWKIDGQDIVIIKRGVAVASERPGTTRGRRQRINGNNKVTDKNSNSNTFADQKTANVNSAAEGKVFDSTSKKTTDN